MEELSPIELLNQKHKLEKKNLQAQIQSLKKTVTKGDKKKQKEVHAEITKLEDVLAKKHAEELKELEDTTPKEVETIEALADKIDEVAVEEAPKLTKAQKRRQKKHESNKERDLRIAQEEEENKDCLRNTESRKINEKLRKKSLMIFEVPSDGDCMYKAVSHGLQKMGIALGVDLLRQRVSQHILANPDEYQPFLTDPVTGDLMDDDKFRDYCEKIANTKQWGGQVELDALTRILEKTLVIVQGDGPELHMGEQFSGYGEMTLTYHRHMYKLGEHYNSVQPLVEEEDF